MIRAVKDEVLEKLKLKRLSPNSHSLKQDNFQKAVTDAGGSQQPKKDQDNGLKTKNHIQILEMLEQFERQSPQALNIFIENAKSKGVYKSMRESVEFRKHTQSTFTKSIDFASSVTERRFNLSALGNTNSTQKDEFTELPKRFSKLVTFKSVSKNESPISKRSGGMRQSHNNVRGQILFDSIQDINGRGKFQFRAPSKLDNTAPTSPLRSATGSSSLAMRNDTSDSRNLTKGFPSIYKRPLPSIMKKQDDFQSRKQLLNLRYNSRASSDGGDDEYISEPQMVGDHTNKYKDSSLQRASNKDKNNNTQYSGSFQIGDKMQSRKETIGSASFVTPYEQMSIDQIINKRSLALSKVPKIAPLVEKSDKFHDFFKKLCGVQHQNNTAQGINSYNKQESIAAQGDTNGNLLQPNQLSANLIKNLRLSKQNIKAHLAKRYGKVISERIMITLESCNKTMHNIEYNGYLDLIYYCFFSLQSVTVNGQVYLIPNMYKMLYQMFDGTNKGFFCEHDLFQIIWSIHQGKQGVGPNSAGQNGTDMVQGLEPKTNGCNYQIDKSSYADVDSHNYSVNYRDTFPKLKRSVFIEAFQQDLNIYSSEFERLKQLQLMRSRESPMPYDYGFSQMNATQSNGFKTKKRLGSTSKKISQSIDQDDPHSKTSTKLPAKPSSPETRRLSMLQSKLKQTGANAFGQGLEKKKNPKSFYGGLVESIKLHTQEIIELQNEDSKSKQSKQQATQMVGNGNNVVNFSANAFNHHNPIKQIFLEKKKYHEDIQEILKQENCRQMTFEQFFRINKFENEIPQFLDDLFQHLTTLSLKETLKKGTTQSLLTRQMSLKRENNRNESSVQSHIRNNYHVYVNPFTQISHEELSLMKRQLTFLNIMKHYNDVDIRYLIQSFTLLAQNSSTEKEVLKMFISQQSILDNYKKVFKIHNESMALRLYNALSHGVNFNRIYLTTYLTRLHPLFSGELVDQLYFVFSLFDSDLDRKITSQDISDFLTNVVTCASHKNDVRDQKPCTCRLFEEFDIMYKEYVKENLMQFRVKRQLIDFEFYLRHVQYSCLIEELIDKLLMTWDRPSIFSHDPKDMELLEKMFEYDRNQNYSYISSINSQGYSNAQEKAFKRTQQFEKKYIDFASNAMPSLKNLNVKITAENQPHISQQAEEDFASFMLASHKAELEITRIMNIIPESLPKNPRVLKRIMMRQDLGLALPENLAVLTENPIPSEPSI